MKRKINVLLFLPVLAFAALLVIAASSGTLLPNSITTAKQTQVTNVVLHMVSTNGAGTNGQVLYTDGTYFYTAPAALGGGSSLTNANLVGTTTNSGDLLVSGTITGNGMGLTNLTKAAHTLGSSTQTQFGSGVSQYFPLLGSASASSSEVTVSTPLITGGLLTNLVVKTASVGPGTNFSLFVMTNGQRSSLSVSYDGNGAAQSSVNTSTGIIIPANTTVSCCVTGNNASAANNIRLFWSVEKVNQ